MRVLLILSLAHLTLALWPVPRNLKTGTNLVKLSSSFEISVSLPAEAPRDLLSAIQRTKDHLANDKHRRLTPTRGEEDRSALPSTPTLALLELSIPASAGRVASIAEKAVKDISRRDEAYSLHLPADGSLARISANSTLGLLRGLTTFEQLWYWIPDTVYAHEAPVVIENDAPAFVRLPFYSLSVMLTITSSRTAASCSTQRETCTPSFTLSPRAPLTFNSFPVEDIKRTLSAMSLVKMSVFHWHIVDAQSFPLYVPSIPSLSEQGAYSPEEVYSEKDVQDIVQYAAERGIDVVIVRFLISMRIPSLMHGLSNRRSTHRDTQRPSRTHIPPTSLVPARTPGLFTLPNLHQANSASLRLPPSTSRSPCSRMSLVVYLEQCSAPAGTRSICDATRKMQRRRESWASEGLGWTWLWRSL